MAAGSPIILTPPEYGHALNEVDAAAQAMAETPEQAVASLDEVIYGVLPGQTCRGVGGCCAS
jgi:hypothetical protein